MPLNAGTVPNRNGAVTSAVLVHLRVEPAHFDWRWRERPALALLAWEALARDPLARLRRIYVESINFRPRVSDHGQGPWPLSIARCHRAAPQRYTWKSITRALAGPRSGKGGVVRVELLQTVDGCSVGPQLPSKDGAHRLQA